MDPYVYAYLIIHNRFIDNRKWKSKIEDVRINCLLFNAMKFMLIIYMYSSQNPIKYILELHRFFMQQVIYANVRKYCLVLHILLLRIVSIAHAILL